MENKLFLLAGPSGVGKTTIQQCLTKNIVSLESAVSHTTREPRAGEISGVDYHFVSINHFFELSLQYNFLETNAIYGNYYGLSYSEVFPRLNKNISCITPMEGNGCIGIKRILPESTIVIFLLPSSIKELVKRTSSRTILSETDKKKRITGIELEIKARKKYMDYEIVNGNLDQTIKDITKIINNEVNN